MGSHCSHDRSSPVPVKELFLELSTNRYKLQDCHPLDCILNSRSQSNHIQHSGDNCPYPTLTQPLKHPPPNLQHQTMCLHTRILYQCTCPPCLPLINPCVQASSCTIVTVHQINVYGACPACCGRPWPFEASTGPYTERRILAPQSSQHRREKVGDWLGRRGSGIPVARRAPFDNSSGGNGVVDASIGCPVRGRDAVAVPARRRSVLSIDEMLNPPDSEDAVRANARNSSFAAGPWDKA